MKNVRLENQGYMGMTSTRSPMFLEAQPRHDGHPMVSLRIGNAEHSGEEFGINLTFEQARSFARQLTAAIVAAEKEFKGLGLPN